MSVITKKKHVVNEALQRFELPDDKHYIVKVKLNEINKVRLFCFQNDSTCRIHKDAYNRKLTIQQNLIIFEFLVQIFSTFKDSFNLLLVQEIFFSYIHKNKKFKCNQ